MDGFDEDDFDAPSSSFESLRDLDGLVINKLPEPDSELMQRMSKKEIVEYLRAVTGVDQDFTRSGQMPPKAGRQGSGTVILSDVAANSDNGDQIVHVDIASELASVWNDSDDGDGDLSELDEKLLAEKYGMTIQTDEELEAQYELEEQTRRPQGFGYSPVTHATAVPTSSTVLESGLQELDLVNVDARGTGFGGTPKRLRAKLPSVKEAGGPQKYSELLELSDEAEGQNAPIPSDTKEHKALKSIAEFVPAQRFMRRQMYKPQARPAVVPGLVVLVSQVVACCLIFVLDLQTLLQRKTSSRLQDLIEMAYDHPNVLGRGTGFSELETISPSGCPPQVEAVYVTPCLKEAHVFWSLPWDAPEPQSAGVDEVGCSPQLSLPCRTSYLSVLRGWCCRLLNGAKVCWRNRDDGCTRGFQRP